MSCALPTVGCNVDGVPELITDGLDGILVPPQDPAALAATLTRLAHDPDLCLALGAAGRTRVETAFRTADGAAMLIREIKGDGHGDPGLPPAFPAPQRAA